ncbi:Murein DD-endopeptidase MepM [Thalassocella blandensis]|nr:Murein DD-endopeptidase MepM [Thalassocella blandensis]
MEPIDYAKKKPTQTHAHSLAQRDQRDTAPRKWSRFPNGHIIALCALCACLLGFTLLPSDKASAKRNIQEIELPISFDEDFIDSDDPLSPAEDVSSVALPLTRHVKEKIKSGDNLYGIFKRVGLSGKYVAALLKTPESKKLAAMYPGHTLEFNISEDNELNSLTYIKDPLHSYTFTHEEGSYIYSELSRQPDVQIAVAYAKIEQSLYLAGRQARLDDKLVMELADVFGWDIDFALDIRKGDQFKVIYEEKFLDGVKIGNGDILAAEFINQGETFRAVRYMNTRDEVSYYTPRGESMRKPFLRAPLDFRRISSNFNPNRLHPVFKTVRAHRGVDYAADRGTPVWASGDGRVLKAGYSKANGNYVFIQHGNNVETKYLHLQKRYVKTGQRVKQKQLIGAVGSTGYATGPHLHYEFLLNGVHRNPRTIVNRLPKSKSISVNEMSRFIQFTQNLVAQLEQPVSPTMYAEAESASTSQAL